MPIEQVVPRSQNWHDAPAVPQKTLPSPAWHFPDESQQPAQVEAQSF